MRLVVRLQAFFRGALARKKVKQVYGFTVRPRPDSNLAYYNQQPNYDNPLVQSIKQRLGAFHFDSAIVTKDNVRR